MKEDNELIVIRNEHCKINGRCNPTVKKIHLSNDLSNIKTLTLKEHVTKYVLTK